MASSQVETVSTTADKAKLGLSVVLVLASLVSFYLLAKQGQIAQWGALLVCLVAAAAVFMSSETGRQFLAFGRDSVREVKKSGLARTQRSLADDRLCFCFCRGDGAVFVDHGQTP